MRVLLLSALAILLLGAGAVEAVDIYGDYQTEKQKSEQVRAIIPLIEIEDGASFHARIDAVRDFVYSNSQHEVDDEFYSHWEDVPLMLRKVRDYAVSMPQKPEDAPHLECSTRSTLIREVLHDMGIRTLSVSIYRQTRGYPGHTFFEVYNPDDKRWEVQDADFNIFWQRNEDGKRASIHDLMARSIDAFTPCSFDGECGKGGIPARTTNRMFDLETRFGVASIIDKDAGYRPLLVNTERFDLDKKIEVGDEMLTYCQHMAKNCRQDITLYP